MTMTTAIQIGALVFMTLLPIALSGILYVVERQQWTKKISYAVKQAIIGVLFGLIAVLATEVGIPVNGAVLNVRNAAPLTAGLLFGGPAGIIAGLIGGVYRWFATWSAAGMLSMSVLADTTADSSFNRTRTSAPRLSSVREMSER